MPALGTPNADSGALAHLVGFGPLDEKVHAFSGSADVLPGRVVPRVKPPVLEGKFADPQETKKAEGTGHSEHLTVVSFQGGCLQPLQHVTQRISTVSGSRVGLRWMGSWRRWTPRMASCSVGLLDTGLLYPMEWCRNETAAT